MTLQYEYQFPMGKVKPNDLVLALGDGVKVSIPYGKGKVRDLNGL